MSLLRPDLPQVALSQSAIPSAGLMPASAAALEHLLAVAGLCLEPSQVREVLGQGGLDADTAASLPAAASADPPGPRESWESVLTGAGEALGLRVIRLQLSVREVAERTQEAPLPLLVLPVHIYTVYALNMLLLIWATVLHSSANWLGNVQADATLAATRHWVDSLTRSNTLVCMWASNTA